MKRRFSITGLCTGTLAAALLFAGGNGSATTAGEASKADRERPEGSTQSVSSAATGRAALTVYKDPATGKLSPVPASVPEELLSDEMRAAFSTSSEGLLEVKAPGGGMMVDLQKRFQNVQMATVGTDGSVHTHCGDPSHLAQAGKE